MNSFDLEIIRYVNQFSQQSWLLDHLAVFLSFNNLLKGGVFAIVLWWAWFKPAAQDSQQREHVFLTLLSCVVAMGLARGLALSLPLRLRPLHEAALHFLIPNGEPPDRLDGWSSFPSDHAALFFTLATGLFFINRTVGIVAFLYSTLVIAIPRIYLGLHYPTDIIVGAIIGIITAVLINSYLVKNQATQLIVNLSTTMPHIFYPLFFLFTYQIADMFTGSRAILGGVLKLFKNIAI